MPRLPRAVKKPTRIRVTTLPRWVRQIQRLWGAIPPSSHGIWAVARLGVLAGVLYFNASNFDITEGRTLITMTLLEVAGFKRRS